MDPTGLKMYGPCRSIVGNENWQHCVHHYMTWHGVRRPHSTSPTQLCCFVIWPAPGAVRLNSGLWILSSNGGYVLFVLLLQGTPLDISTIHVFNPDILSIRIGAREITTSMLFLNSNSVSTWWPNHCSYFIVLFSTVEINDKPVLILMVHSPSMHGEEESQWY